MFNTKNRKRYQRGPGPAVAANPAPLLRTYRKPDMWQGVRMSKFWRTGFRNDVVCLVVRSLSQVTKASVRCLTERGLSVMAQSDA